MNWFQSTPHLSGKANSLELLALMNLLEFQSTPHLSGKANVTTSLLGFLPRVSIHASPQRQGELPPCLVDVSQHRVSIHASPQRQGELQGRELQAHKKGFQSTPHLSGKANFLLGLNCVVIEVSIHASPQRQGELRRQLHGFVIAMFQSTPHLSGKANAGRGCGLTFVLGFNPRLTSAARRTQSAEVEALPPEVSIHASPQRQGERRNIVRLLQVKLVSIHASPQRQGEPQNDGQNREQLLRFNPRLTSAARRTLPPEAHKSDVESFNPRLTSAARRTYSQNL